MDDSGSVKVKNFVKMKNFVKALSDQLTISKTGTHMGLIVFSTSARVSFTMANSQYYNKTYLKAKIDSIKYTDGSKYTYCILGFSRLRVCVCLCVCVRARARMCVCVCVRGVGGVGGWPAY